MDRGLLPCALLVASSLLLAFSSGLQFKSLGMLSMGRKHFLCTSTVAYGKAPRLRNVEHVEMIAIPDLHDDFEIEFAVFGVPIPLQRHRVSRGVIFNPSRKEQLAFSASSRRYIEKPFDGPVEATLLFYFPRPKSHYGTGRNKDILKDNSPIWFTKRKDLDNLIKFVLDSLNGQAYFDDSQIVSIHAYKFYTCEEPRVQIRLRKVVG